MQIDKLKYATGLKRLGAALVDGIVFAPLIFVENWIFASTESPAIKIMWSLFVMILTSFYSIFLHFKFGQTLGKWVVGVKVMNVNEQDGLTFKQAAMRDSFCILVEFYAILYVAFLYFSQTQQSDLFEEYADFTTYPLFIWTLIELVSMLTNSKRRAVHDFMANSVVVRVQPRLSVQQS